MKRSSFESFLAVFNLKANTQLNRIYSHNPSGFIIQFNKMLSEETPRFHIQRIIRKHILLKKNDKLAILDRYSANCITDAQTRIDNEILYAYARIVELAMKDGYLDQVGISFTQFITSNEYINDFLYVLYTYEEIIQSCPNILQTDNFKQLDLSSLGETLSLKESIKVSSEASIIRRVLILAHTYDETLINRYTNEKLNDQILKAQGLKRREVNAFNQTVSGVFKALGLNRKSLERPNRTIKNSTGKEIRKISRYKKIT